MSGDCFGDAVNVAARLLDHAGDNETLVTASVVDGLDDGERVALSQPRPDAAARPRRAGARAPAGSGAPLRRHRGDGLRRHGAGVAEPEGIRLIWLDLNRIYSRHQPAGRPRPQPAGHLLHRRHRVSRSHARIDWHGGTFQLTDLSYNGTYVRFDNDPEIISLRRGTCTLHGSGVIGLGTPPSGAGRARACASR